MCEIYGGPPGGGGGGVLKKLAKNRVILKEHSSQIEQDTKANHPSFKTLDFVSNNNIGQITQDI